MKANETFRADTTKQALVIIRMTVRSEELSKKRALGRKGFETREGSTVRPEKPIAEG